MKSYLYFMIFAVLSLTMCVNSVSTISKVSFDNINVSAEIADSPDEWQKGLMERVELSEGTGMLFVFPDSARRSFWMKDTLLSLDIIFISSDLRVADIKKNFEPCRTLICETYTSKENAKYVLEVNANFADKHVIKIGDDIKLL